MPRLSTSQHQWVQYTVTLGEVIVDPDGRPFFVPRAPEELDVLESPVGCGRCDQPLTVGSAVTACEGD